MASIEVKPSIEIGIEEILGGIANLDTPDLESFLKEVGYLLAQRKANILEKREAELLQQINETVLNGKLLEKYNQLYSKLENEQISEVEHEQLLDLIKQRERLGVERMAYLVELAQFKKISINELMHQLGLETISNA